MKTVALVTDLFYEAKGREYFREDILLCKDLRKHFKVVISHIDDVDKVLDSVDIILIRNTGPLSTHKEALDKLRDHAVYNDLLGKGDIKGKRHLLELYKLGYPVIPTFDNTNGLSGSEYLVKPIDGADSVGVRRLTEAHVCKNALIQPVMSFKYEVSFYYIGKKLLYALYAPDPEKRWELKRYEPTEEDRDFAWQFIHWNSCQFGIQRVDAVRCTDSKLLLMELEDYNPYLSLHVLDDTTRKIFIETLCYDLNEMSRNLCRI